MVKKYMQRNEYLQFALSECKNPNIIQELTTAQILFPLWKEWNNVIEESIATYIYPIGTKKRTLLVGTRDSSSFQEIHYYKQILIDSINTFLKQDYFTDVLVQYNTELPSLAIQAQKEHIPSKKCTFQQHSIQQTILPSTSIVAKAYSAFLSVAQHNEG